MRLRVIAIPLLALAIATSGCQLRSQQERNEPVKGADDQVQAPDDRTFFDLRYADVSARHKLDLFLPKDGGGTFPVIVFVHGGGYMSGSKEDIVPGIKEAAEERGYAVASVGYRLTDEAGFPAQIEDVKAAIRWIRAHSGDYSLDEERIAIWGFSAGAHLAALAGTSAGVESLEGTYLGNAEESAAVQAVVDWSGPADFFALHRYLAEQRREGRGLFENELTYLRDEVRSEPDLVRLADPATHGDPTDPPILIQHGTADTIVPVSQSVQLANSLRESVGAGKVTLRTELGAGHLDEAILGPRNIDRTLDWLEDAMPAE